MHLEVLVEDSSGERLLEILLPKLLGADPAAHSYRLHSYRGIGRIPPDLVAAADPTKRMLLDQLPRLLRGYGKTPGIDAVVVVLDADRRDCKAFLSELRALVTGCPGAPTTMIRLAVEEMEAWYLGDRAALFEAFPRAKKAIVAKYVQDSVCGTWEVVADAVHPGGSAAVKKAGWPLPGQLKHEWAERIGPLMSVDANQSPSFGKLRDGLRRLVG